jgi:hypothetical protein
MSEPVVEGIRLISNLTLMHFRISGDAEDPESNVSFMLYPNTRGAPK